MDSGEITAIVGFVGMGLTYFGVTGVDSTVLTGVVNDIIGLISFGALLWSWWVHHKANNS
jgi:hypothetical protein